MALEARDHGIELVVIKLPEAKQDLLLLPRRWVVKRSLPRLSRIGRLANNYEQLPETVIGSHCMDNVCLLLHMAVHLLQIDNAVN
jgi:hypothetical protein